MVHPDSTSLAAKVSDVPRLSGGAF